MNTNKQVVVKEKPVQRSLSEKKDSDFLVNNLFRPPKNDTNYFYYTEVISDWVNQK